jgi:hypothetical protein
MQKSFSFYPPARVQKASDFFVFKSELPPGVVLPPSSRFAKILKSQMVVKLRDTATQA